MKAEWVAVLLTGAGQFAAVLVLAWKTGRYGGSLASEMRHLAEAMREQATSMDNLASTVATESKSNAVQDARLDDHADRLDRHDEAINDLRRAR